MTDVGQHCWTWAWLEGGLAQRCPHCGKVNARWESLTDDDSERVRESQKNHLDNCPGLPWCTRRGRR